MIVDLPLTTTSKISRKLQELRESGGVVALGRVLSLIVETEEQDVEKAVLVANGASRLHPSRIIIISRSPAESSRLDAEIRVGGDAGASEVIVLRAAGEVSKHIESLVSGLLLPDAPIVAWWPKTTSPNPSHTDIGAIADRRITDSATQRDPLTFLVGLASNYRPGDGDMAWTRITLWRSQIAAALQSHLSKELKSARVFGSKESPSAHLLQAWMQIKLGVPVSLEFEWKGSQVSGIGGIQIELEDGELSIIRNGDIATITQPGLPESKVFLPARSDLDCLIEDMRFLGEDTEYAEILQRGIGNGN